MQNMNETYLIMAKTVEEAIAIANREYAKDGKEVKYEILEMPKKGFFGIGAREAKIKITVCESESSKIGSELSSLVADLRGMKVHTNRGGSEGEEKSKKQSAPNQKKPNAPQQGQQGQKKPAEKQAQNGQAPKQNAQKPAQPKSEAKPQQAKPAEKPAEPKKDKPQEAKKPQVQKPKAEGQPKSEAKPQKPAEPKPEVKQEPKAAAEPKKSAEPKPERQPKPEAKAEKPAEPKMPKEPKEPKMPKEPKEPKESKPAEPVTAETAAEPAKTEYKSSLRNQAKPQRRQKTPKSAAADAVPGAEAIIAAPMGLTDFTREENGVSFGSDSSSGGRMSNDIRKKPRAPKQAIKPEQIAENVKEAKEYKEIRPEIEEAVLPALHEEDDVFVRELPEEPVLPEIAEEAAESEAAEAPAVEEDRQKVGVTEAEMQYALDFTNTLLKNMAIGATASRVECPEGEEYIIEGDANVYPKINIDGDGTGILIGHHGETLDAVQYLVNLAALRQSKQKGGDYVKIVVDIENYRAKREETLRSLARRMAARAVKYKRNVFLEPMNAYERRIIHSELHSFENVSTHSVGADKNRKIIITYEGPDKAPQQPRREKEERADKPERSEKREGKQESKGGSAGSASRRNENRRPKKIQKMPIEKLPDFLASGMVEENDRFVEIED